MHQDSNVQALHAALQHWHHLSSSSMMQVNYLGPYYLTRLLESTLIASRPSRVVNVSSIMHRSGHVDKNTEAFLSDWNKGSQYSNTKLANVLFAYESQRRLGPHGVQVNLMFMALHVTTLYTVSTSSTLQCRVPVVHQCDTVYSTHM